MCEKDLEKRLSVLEYAVAGLIVVCVVLVACLFSVNGKYNKLNQYVSENVQIERSENTGIGVSGTGATYEDAKNNADALEQSSDQTAR